MDQMLRALKEFQDKTIEAKDGKIGIAGTFLFDDAEWIIRYLVIDLGHWLPGKKVLVSPQWITKVVWKDKKVFVDLPRKTIKECPEYDPGELIEREYETKMYEHYRKPKYW